MRMVNTGGGGGICGYGGWKWVAFEGVVLCVLSETKKRGKVSCGANHVDRIGLMKRI